jgi:molybdopterin converting factor small subunit
MRVRLLHFASFREAVGRDLEERELDEGTRVEDLWAALGREVALFRRFPSIPPAAVNREYVGSDTVLRDGDEVTFLPPVAGG